MGCVTGQKQNKPPSARDVTEPTIPVININGETQYSISMNSLTEITGMLNTKDPRFSQLSIYITRNKKILEPPSPIQEEKYEINENHNKELINSAVNILVESDFGRKFEEKHVQTDIAFSHPEQNFPTTPKVSKKDSYFLSTQHTGLNSVNNKKQDVSGEEEVPDEDGMPFEKFISWKTIRLE